MKQLDLAKIKYYPDRFYICLDGFDIQNLTSFITDLDLGDQQAIFIHEYYHYLTNITTFPGIRQFHLNFCDRFSLVTNLTFKEGLKAFPINQNNLESCKGDVLYWNNSIQMLEDDDIDYDLIDKVESCHNRRFEVCGISLEELPMHVVVEEQVINGMRTLIKVNITGVVGQDSFYLTYGAIDEFLSSAIDEFLFEHDLAELDPHELSRRPFYPYRVFDEILNYYQIRRPSSFEKILISYFALNSQNPALKLKEILEILSSEGEYEKFQQNPDLFLLDYFQETPNYERVLDKTKKFANQTFEQGRVHISQAIKYYYDKFYLAQKLKENDFFYFIRPFFTKELNTISGKQKFLLELSRIINVYSPPVILKDKQFYYIDKLTTFGEATLLIIATYEIFESLKTQKMAKRPEYLKSKYAYPDGNKECDDYMTYQPPPITAVFQLALNEINLYKLYLEEKERH